MQRQDIHNLAFGQLRVSLCLVPLEQVKEGNKGAQQSQAATVASAKARKQVGRRIAKSAKAKAKHSDATKLLFSSSGSGDFSLFRGTV